MRNERGVIGMGLALAMVLMMGIMMGVMMLGGHKRGGHGEAEGQNHDHK